MWHIFVVCIRVSNSFSFLTNSFMSSMFIWWSIFRFGKIVTLAHYVNLWLKNIIALTNNNGDSTFSLEYTSLDLAPLLKFFLLSIPLSSFSWFPGYTLWLCRISCIFWDRLYYPALLKIFVDPWKFSRLLLYILWDDWPIFMISGSNQQLQQQLEYTLLKPDCHSWWISKMQSGHEDTLEERHAIKFCFKLGKKCHRNVWNASHCFWSILHESSISFWVV